MDQLPNHRPIYVDDECSTYQETRSEAAWRLTAFDGTGGDETNPQSNGNGGVIGTNNEVYPMGWIPTYQHDGNTPATTASGRTRTGGATTLPNGMAFSVYDGSAPTITTDLRFTGHRVNLGLSYSKFAYDGSNNLQLNAQLSQWESTCRWCCHARPDTVCNIEMKEINSSPFSTKCGNPVGTKRHVEVQVLGPTDPATVGAIDTYKVHPLYAITKNFEDAISGLTGVGASYASSERAYWGLLGSTTASVNAVDLSEKAKQAGAGANSSDVHEDNRCSLSNAQWTPHLPDPTDTTSVVTSANEAQYFQNNKARLPQGLKNKFRFFQPFNIAQSNADYYNEDVFTCGNTSNLGNVCTVANVATDCGAGGTCVAGRYEQGPRFWMQMFQRTPQYDLSHFTSRGQTNFYAKFPATGEGRNSAGMDKFAGRGNKSRWTTESGNGLTEAILRDNSELQHFYQQQTDMVSQENRDFFDSRARDAATSYGTSNMYLKRWDNTEHWNQK